MEKTDILVINARNSQLSGSQRQLAFSELVNRYYNAAYQWAFLILEDIHTAQDTAQEAFVAAYQNLDQLREPIAFASWLRQIVHSQAHRLIRNKQLDTESIDDDNDTTLGHFSPEFLIEQAELKENVMAAIHALPEKEQLVTEMFYLKGYSQTEIARMLELPLTTVKKRLQYARQNLRILLDAITPTPEPEPIPIPLPAHRYSSTR
jgi:RNA polymerase sigma-70 factor (ECF subfamily)